MQDNKYQLTWINRREARRQAKKDERFAKGDWGDKKNKIDIDKVLENNRLLLEWT